MESGRQGYLNMKRVTKMFPKSGYIYWGPRSDRTICGKPWRRNISCRKIVPNSSAVGNFFNAVKWAILENESTVTIITQQPADGGNEEIKSVDTVCHGAGGMGKGWSRPTGLVWGTLTCAQIGQEDTYTSVSSHTEGHQSEWQINSRVDLKPRWPAIGESWHICRASVCTFFVGRNMAFPL